MSIEEIIQEQGDWLGTGLYSGPTRWHWDFLNRGDQLVWPRRHHMYPPDPQAPPKKAKRNRRAKPAPENPASEEGLPKGVQVRKRDKEKPAAIDQRSVHTPQPPQRRACIANVALIPALQHNREYRKWVKAQAKKADQRHQTAISGSEDWAADCTGSEEDTDGYGSMARSSRDERRLKRQQEQEEWFSGITSQFMSTFAADSEDRDEPKKCTSMDRRASEEPAGADQEPPSLYMGPLPKKRKSRRALERRMQKLRTDAERDLDDEIKKRLPQPRASPKLKRSRPKPKPPPKEQKPRAQQRVRVRKPVDQEEPRMLQQRPPEDTFVLRDDSGKYSDDEAEDDDYSQDDSPNKDPRDQSEAEQSYDDDKEAEESYDDDKDEDNSQSDNSDKDSEDETSKKSDVSDQDSDQDKGDDKEDYSDQDSDRDNEDEKEGDSGEDSDQNKEDEKADDSDQDSGGGSSGGSDSDNSDRSADDNSDDDARSSNSESDSESDSDKDSEDSD